MSALGGAEQSKLAKEQRSTVLVCRGVLVVLGAGTLCIWMASAIAAPLSGSVSDLNIGSRKAAFLQRVHEDKKDHTHTDKEKKKDKSQDKK